MKNLTLIIFLLCSVVQAIYTGLSVCKAPAGSFHGEESRNYMECAVNSYDFMTIEFQCGLDVVIYNGRFNVFGIDMDNRTSKMRTLTIYAVCYDYGSPDSKGHAGMYWPVLAYRHLTGIYPGMNYACDIQKHTDMRIYAYTMSNEDAVECQKHPIKAIA